MDHLDSLGELLTTTMVKYSFANYSQHAPTYIKLFLGPLTTTKCNYNTKLTACTLACALMSDKQPEHANIRLKYKK